MKTFNERLYVLRKCYKPGTRIIGVDFQGANQALVFRQTLKGEFIIERCLLGDYGHVEDHSIIERTKYIRQAIKAWYTLMEYWSDSSKGKAVC